MRKRHWLRAAAPAVMVLALLAAPAAGRAEVFELADGTSVDGKKLRETDEFVWVRTLSGVEKLAVGQIKGRTAGESPVEVYGRLKKAAEAAPKDVQALWALYEFVRGQSVPALEKEQKSRLRKILKLAPEHPAARDANGEARFQGKWVPKEDLERLQAEYEANKVRLEWEKKLGLALDVFETEHFLLLDNTEEKDLAGRGKALDETYGHLSEVLAREKLWDGKCVVVTVREYDDYVRVVDSYKSVWRMSDAWMESVKREDQGGLWRDRPGAMQVRWPSSGDEGMWAAIIHNCAHIAIWRLWGTRKVPPTWLEEGLGVWVELQVTDDNLATCIGGSSAKKEKTHVRKKKKKGKGDSLRETQSEWKERCVEAIGAGEFPSLRKFLRMKQGDYGPAEEGGALGLVTWLMGLDQEKFRKLLALMKIHTKDDPPWRETYDDWHVIEDAEKVWFLWVQTDW